MKELRIRPTGRIGLMLSWESNPDPRKYSDLLVTGDFEVEEIDHNAYVQVEFVFGTQYKLYTYIDPSKTLRVGDLVDVPTQYEDHNVALVKKLGDGYKGRSHMQVRGKYNREVLAETINPAVGKGFDPAGPYDGY